MRRKMIAGAIALAGGLTLIAATGYSLSASQYGTYSGIMTLKVHDSTGKTSSRKLIMGMQVGPNTFSGGGTTTVTLNGIPQYDGGAVFGASEGFSDFTTPGPQGPVGSERTEYYTLLHAKGTSIKGTMTGAHFFAGDPTSIVESYEGKITLKKLP